MPRFVQLDKGGNVRIGSRLPDIVGPVDNESLDIPEEDDHLLEVGVGTSLRRRSGRRFGCRRRGAGGGGT